ncbi:42854_t:CDS:2, partial [Gigaspora margarita]
MLLKLLDNQYLQQKSKILYLEEINDLVKCFAEKRPELNCKLINHLKCKINQLKLDFAEANFKSIEHWKKINYIDYNLKLLEKSFYLLVDLLVDVLDPKDVLIDVLGSEDVLVDVLDSEDVIVDVLDSEDELPSLKQILRDPRKTDLKKLISTILELRLLILREFILHLITIFENESSNIKPSSPNTIQHSENGEENEI